MRESQCELFGDPNIDVSEDIFKIPYVAVYIYKAGSPFETVVTQYMISGKGVNPFNPGGLGLKGTDMNISVPGPTLSASAATTLS